MELNRIEKISESVKYIDEICFDMLYFAKCTKENLSEIREKSLESEEYEKVMMVDKLIEIEYYFENTIWEDTNLCKSSLDLMEKETMELILLMISPNQEPEYIKNKYENVIKYFKESALKIMDIRIEFIKNREINPFEQGDKYYNMFEYFRTDAIKHFNKLKEYYKSL